MDQMLMPEAQASIQSPHPLLTTPLDVLIVEDDPYISVFLYEILQFLDPSVSVDHFQSAELARNRLLAKARTSPNLPYSFVIADVYLSGHETGFELWRMCKGQFPELPVVVTSILTRREFDQFTRQQELPPLFLPKPFSIRECIEFFRKVIDTVPSKSNLG